MRGGASYRKDRIRLDGVVLQGCVIVRRKDGKVFDEYAKFGNKGKRGDFATMVTWLQAKNEFVYV